VSGVHAQSHAIYFASDPNATTLLLLKGCTEFLLPFTVKVCLISFIDTYETANTNASPPRYAPNLYSLFSNS
jgi:hypothetical protein